jgi:hypothetical protein
MTYIKIILLAACFELLNCLGISVKDEAPSTELRITKIVMVELSSPKKQDADKDRSHYFPKNILIR